jgi:hypothetical protein
MKLLLPAFNGNYSLIEIRNVIITKNDKCGSNNLRQQKNGRMKVHPFIEKLN